jgi:hypothetical protein
MGLRGVLHKAAHRILGVKEIHSSNMAVRMPLHMLQMDVVVQAASAPGVNGAWLRLLREGGIDFWTAIVSECVTVHSVCLSHWPRRRYLHCLAQYGIHAALFLGKLCYAYNGLRRGLDLVRTKNIFNVMLSERTKCTKCTYCGKTTTTKRPKCTNVVLGCRRRGS